MTLALAFWILMLIWLITGLWQNGISNFKASAGNLMLFIILVLVGWQLFGPALHR